MREGAVSLSGGTMTAEPGESFATLTHARLRAAQGDIGGAARILRVILEVQPAHREARELLDEITGRVAVRHEEPAERPAAEIVPAAAGDLAGQFRDALGGNRRRIRVERLSRWLQRMQRNRATRDAR
jgi:hypothetical protein